MDYEVMPWHRSSWDNLMGRMTAGQLPHALLLTGPAGIGKNQFADLFTRSVLCRQPQMHGIACGECRTCLLTRAETHPDVHWVTPPEEGKVIGVDQIREITNYLSLKSQYGGYKLAIISPADRLRASPPWPVAQKIQPMPHPTWVEIHAVCRS